MLELVEFDVEVEVELDAAALDDESLLELDESLAALDDFDEERLSVL